MRSVATWILPLWLGCGTEVVELATVDSGSSAVDAAVTDNGILPEPDSGVADLGFPDLGFLDVGADAEPDTGVPEDSGVMIPECACRLRCSSNPECTGVGPASLCTSGYCSLPPGDPGCRSDADCAARALCLTLAEPVVGCR